MLPRAKLIPIWVVASLSTVLACHALLTAVALVVLTATGSWIDDYTTLWVLGASTLFFLCTYIAIKTVVFLIRYYNSLHHPPGKEEVLNR